MTIYKNHSEICKALFDVTNGKTVDDIKAAMADRSSEAFYVSRLFKRYNDAHEASKKFGFIGVGCISFAQTRLQEFQRRLGVE